MRSIRAALFSLAVAGFAMPSAAQAALPGELAPFVAKGMQPVAFEAADLNADGLGDYILVSEPVARENDETDPLEIRRTLMVVVRDAKNALRVAARSDRAVYCAACGGMMGDPFEGIAAEKGKFTVSHYGGSGWRWANESTFAWSRRDEAWQLVRVEEVSFHASEPEKEERAVFTPPKDFGKIDLEDFDPENWKGVGPK